MTSADVAAIDAMQDGDSAWTGADYLNWTTFVAIVDGNTLAGFACGRTLVPNTEHEVLNVLVASKHRGKGIGSKLMKTLLAGSEGIWFLEVRESNTPARHLYKSLGFSDFGKRNGYYQKPYEDAIVMRFCS
jgi:ribosomal-protein-alanine N-acetyltransferase